MLFEYTAMDSKGKQCRGTIAANNMTDASSQLKNSALFPTSIIESKKKEESVEVKQEKKSITKGNLKMFKVLGVAGIMTLFTVLFIFGPLAVVWSLNTLFNLTIAYDISTWAAVIILCGAIRANFYYKKS